MAKIVFNDGDWIEDLFTYQGMWQAPAQIKPTPPTMYSPLLTIRPFRENANWKARYIWPQANRPGQQAGVAKWLGIEDAEL